MNEVQVQEKLKHIKNPVTQKSFEEEKRWREISFTSSTLTIVYDREGISPQDKRLIESMIIENLKNDISPEKVIIKTVSNNSSDVLKAVAPSNSKTPAAEPAQIKTGHAQPMAKKNVPGVGKVICIGSGKGGVGKSTFTVNLASTLLRMGKKVGIIDADIYGPSIPMLLGKRENKPVASADKKIIPVDSNGLKFLSFGLFIDEKDPVLCR